jgi:hypothetical protein
MTFRMSDDNISFTFGSLLAAIPAISWLWPLQLHAMDAGSMATIWIIKIFGTIILGFLGGLTGMFGKDVYRLIKTKLRENKNLGSNRSSGVDSSDSIDDQRL